MENENFSPVAGWTWEYIQPVTKVPLRQSVGAEGLPALCKCPIYYFRLVDLIYPHPENPEGMYQLPENSLLTRDPNGGGICRLYWTPFYCRRKEVDIKEDKRPPPPWAWINELFVGSKGQLEDVNVTMLGDSDEWRRLGESINACPADPVLPIKLGNKAIELLIDSRATHSVIMNSNGL